MALMKSKVFPSLLLAGAAAAMPASACELEWVETEVWRGYRGTCWLSDLFPKVFEKIEIPPPIVWRTPDLRIPKFKYFPRGTSLELQVDAANEGSARSNASTVHTMVNVMDVMGTNLGPVQGPPVTAIGELDPGDRVRYGVGNVDLSVADTNNDGTRDFDVDLLVVGVIDAATTSQRYGPNYELTNGEANNTTTETCRLYHADSGPWEYVNPPPPCD